MYPSSAVSLCPLVLATLSSLACHSSSCLSPSTFSCASRRSWPGSSLLARSSSCCSATSRRTRDTSASVSTGSPAPARSEDSANTSGLGRARG